MTMLAIIVLPSSSAKRVAGILYVVRAAADLRDFDEIRVPDERAAAAQALDVFRVAFLAHADEHLRLVER